MSDIFLFPSVLTLGRMTSMAEAVTILRAFHYNEIQNVDLSLLRDKGHGWSVLKALHLNINENEKKNSYTGGEHELYFCALHEASQLFYLSKFLCSTCLHLLLLS